MDCGPASGASVDGQGVLDSVYGYAVSQAGLFPVKGITGKHIGEAEYLGAGLGRNGSADLVVCPAGLLSESTQIAEP